jgi:acetyl esterase
VSEPLPEIRTLLVAPQVEVAGPEEPLDIPALRRQCDAFVIAFHRHVRDHGPLHDVRDLVVAGVPVRLYLPSGEETLPVHVHLHGGGFWMGSLETVDPMARELAHVSGMAVVSVGYRLAPEHPFPAGLDDVVTVVQGLTREVLGFAPSTVSLGGESAGANLAAAACLRLRDLGGPLLAAQWLDVPGVDLTAPEDDSSRAYGQGYGLDLEPLRMILALYAPDLTDPLASPALAADLSGLPPAIVTTAECDPIRDQGERFAARLAEAGNDVTLHRALGQIHASSWFTALTDANAAWLEDTVALLVARHRALESVR